MKNEQHEKYLLELEEVPRIDGPRVRLYRLVEVESSCPAPEAAPTPKPAEDFAETVGFSALGDEGTAVFIRMGHPRPGVSWYYYRCAISGARFNAIPAEEQVVQIQFDHPRNKEVMWVLLSEVNTFRYRHNLAARLTELWYAVLEQRDRLNNLALRFSVRFAEAKL